MCTIAAIGRLGPLLRCLAVVLILMTGRGALAQTTIPTPDAPPQVKALLQLLSDPAVQHWLDQQRAAEVKPAPAPEEAAPAATPSSFVDRRLGAFLAFDWPPLLHAIVLGYLLAFLGLRIALVIGRFLLSPAIGRGAENAARFRIIPMDDAAARFWYRRIGRLVAWFAFGYVTVGLLDLVGFQPEARRLVAYVLGLGLLAMGFEIAWRRPRRVELDSDGGVPRPRRAGSPVAVAGWFAALWLLWALHMIPAFWLVLVVV